jgi:cation diffusion facilitator CzcD-associated flavoprotein CzcO
MPSKPSKKVGFDHHHAVVIGAGMAGLLAGRILSDHFDSVAIDFQMRRRHVGGYPKGSISMSC